MSDYADNLRRSMINATRRFMRMVNEMQEKDDAALREQVIRMAREAGIDAESDTLCRYEGWVEPLQRFFHLAAAAGAAAEREACAKVCEDNALKVAAGHFRRGQNDYFGGDYFARAIRARSKE